MKNLMKKISLLLVVILAVVAVGCGNNDKKDVTTTMETFLKAVTDFDLEAMNKLALNEEEDLDMSEMQMFVDVFKKFQEKTTYKINSVEVKNGKATVEVSFSYLDISESFYTAIESLDVEDLADEEAMAKALLDADFGDTMTEKDVTFDLEKVNKEWKIDLDNNDDILDVMTGNAQ